MIYDDENNLVDSTVGLQGPLISKNRDKSFFDLGFNDLNKMPLFEARKKLLTEVEDLSNLPREERFEKLEKLVKKILDFQPMNFDFFYRAFDSSEQKFFIEMISTPGFLDNPVIEEYLNDPVVKMDFRHMPPYYMRHDFLLKFMDYYKKYDAETVDKFCYIFKSCDSVTKHLFCDPYIKFDEMFNEKLLSCFDKDDLAYLYRFNYFKIDNFIEPKNEKALFVLSQLYAKLKESSGPNYEYLQSINSILNNKDTVALLESYFDWVRVNAEGRSFADTISLKDNLGTAELISFFIYYDYEGYNPCVDIVEFLNTLDEKRKVFHEFILGKGCVEKFFYAVYDESDIPKISISDDYDLDKFKKCFLENIYGISLRKAYYITKFYGKHLDEFFKGLPPKPEGMSTEEFLSTLDDSNLAFKKEDYATLQILAAICNVCNLSVDDEKLDEKVRFLQTAYLKQVEDKGLLNKSKFVCFPVLENALNKLYLNSFSKRLMKIQDSKELIGMHNGVMLLDAGVEFDMLVTSIGAVSDIYEDDVNMALKWNTASGSRSQGLCTSHITSQNMGVFTIGSPILGFADLEGTALNMMGTSDIWTNTNSPLLKLSNSANLKKNRTFVPGTIMADETRYGYNELLLDRFVNDDGADNKLQPSYVVYYKFDDDYKNDDRFEQAHKVASDFGVPIMVVDVYKIKDYERQEINKMKEELFSKDVVDKELVHKIITRYMNNHVGAANFVGYFWQKGTSSYPVDFSYEDINTFIDEYLEKAKSSNSVNNFFEWDNALREAYDEESRKYVESQRVSSESYSVRHFLLNDMNLIPRMSMARVEFAAKAKELEKQKQEQASNDFEKGTITLSKDEMSASNIVTLQIVEKINNSPSFNITNDDSDYLISYLTEDALEDKLYSSLIISYLFENTNPIIDDVINSKGKKDIDINAKADYDFVNEVMNSPYKDQLLSFGLNDEKIDGLITKVENEALSLCQNIFPYLNSINSSNLNGTMSIINNIINKSNTIRDDFGKLKNAITGAKNTEVNIGEEGKKL